MSVLPSPLQAQYNASHHGIAYLNSRTKRLLDVIGAVVGLMMGLPIFAVAALIVRFVDGIPPIFRQDRLGYGGQAFSIIKLRTLPIDVTREPNVARIAKKPQYATTRTGKFWRRHSVDETLQFWLVLKGEMSLIGHRPIPMYYLPHMPALDGMTPTSVQHYLDTICQYKPGMSSLSSVNGRGNLAMVEKIQYDLHYAETASFWLDVKLLVLSIKAVITCEGAK